ncbi:hypothetical protein [Chamaesiphon minutus]|uniref:Uncharacterized protein n=1 Tax=Chamaesiphon minutus (strain ATCC 27169 / PCC 6605) TaxID=1173020 RepID=K9UK39_CHAP6|nr:hypothetical protein [Chamaesiphon minutus]AFY94569.1 hypothetical protein Cha6605_3583 [Chamaesiphon minutus PCC 6605]
MTSIWGKDVPTQNLMSVSTKMKMAGSEPERLLVIDLCELATA